MTVVAATGLAREAALIARAGVHAVIAGSDGHRLAQRLDDAIASFRPKGLISAGIAGALDPSLRVGDCVIATEVRSRGISRRSDELWLRAMSARIPDANAGALAGSNEVLLTADQKARLREESGALAVDMESLELAEAAARHSLPFVALRVISDEATQGLPPAASVAIGAEGQTRYGAVALSVLARPQQIPDLIRTGRRASLAFRQLLRCLDLLGPGLACPYLG